MHAELGLKFAALGLERWWMIWGHFWGGFSLKTIKESVYFTVVDSIWSVHHSSNEKSTVPFFFVHQLDSCLPFPALLSSYIGTESSPGIHVISHLLCVSSDPAWKWRSTRRLGRSGRARTVSCSSAETGTRGRLSPSRSLWSRRTIPSSERSRWGRSGCWRYSHGIWIVGVFL